jgi:hypothetical protein
LTSVRCYNFFLKYICTNYFKTAGETTYVEANEISKEDNISIGELEPTEFQIGSDETRLESTTPPHAIVVDKPLGSKAPIPTITPRPGSNDIRSIWNAGIGSIVGLLSKRHHIDVYHVHP